jgi:predicted membrane protein
MKQKYFMLLLILVAIILSYVFLRQFKKENKEKKENFDSKKEKQIVKEQVGSILHTDGLSFGEKISKIKALNRDDEVLRDLIFNNEKMTIELINKYIDTL